MRMMLARFVCPHCGRDVEVTAAASEVFCPCRLGAKHAYTQMRREARTRRSQAR